MKSLRSLGIAGTLALLGGALLLGTSATAEAQSLRFRTTQPGNVIATGNTLGLSKTAGQNGPGIADAIGTFLTLDPNSVDLEPVSPNPWGPGTTNNWMENGSTATLVLPSEAQVLYAELVWGGSYAYGGEDVSADLESPVRLSFGNDSIDVAPNAATGVTLNEQGAFPLRYYMRSNDVTNFLSGHGSGTYSVEGVPATQSTQSNATHAAGWTLVLAYRNDGEPIRNLSVFVGGVFVDEDAEADYVVDGFCAPPSEPIEGTIAIATIEGDANRTGDQLAIGESVNDPTFIALSGPNNPVDNFFCSQINGADGLVDTTGTAGDLNHGTSDPSNNPDTNTNNISGGRQGWDLAQLSLSSEDDHLAPDQTLAVLRARTTSDSFMPVLAGIAIDVNAPKFLYEQSTTTVDRDAVTVGDVMTLSVTILNEGTAPANDVEFVLEMPGGIALNQFSTDGEPGDKAGDPVAFADLATGVFMGDIQPLESRSIEATFEVIAPLSQNLILRPVWNYSYRVCVSDDLIEEEFNGAIATVDYEEVQGTGGGAAGGAGGEGGTGGAQVGGMGGAGGAGGAGAEGGSGGGDASGEYYGEGAGFFRCSSGPSTPASSWALWGIGAVVVALAKRRRTH